MLVLVEEQNYVDLQEKGPTKDNVDINADYANVSDPDQVFKLSTTKSVRVDEELISADIYDPVNWVSIDNNERDTLSGEGVYQRR